jgi:hypothetical protein
VNNSSGLVLVGGVLVIGLIIWTIVSSSAGAAPVASATLAQYNGSGISGTASFVPSSDGKSTNVSLQLSGLQQDAVYSATVNNGACLGPRLFILTAVTGGSTGQGSSTTTLPAQPQSYWFIAVHATASPDAPLVACGQVSVSGATGTYISPSQTAQPSQRIPVQNQQPYQLPNGGGGPPKTPIPTPVAGG